MESNLLVNCYTFNLNFIWCETGRIFGIQRRYPEGDLDVLHTRYILCGSAKSRGWYKIAKINKFMTNGEL
jgi:hypothetical protein